MNYKEMKNVGQCGCCTVICCCEEPPCPPKSSGAIIPYASGLPVAITTLAGGLAGTPAFVGFGTSAPWVMALGSSIDLSLAGGTLADFAFSVPRCGDLTSISVTFFATAAAALPIGNTFIRAEIYKAAANSAVFTPTGAFVDLGPTGPIVVGAIYNGINDSINIPVNAGDLLLLVVSASNDNAASLASIITGYVSAGLSIE